MKYDPYTDSFVDDDNTAPAYTSNRTVPILCSHVCLGRDGFGYCKYTMCINPQFSNYGTAQYGSGVQKVVITNADRIRAMTDEELAEFLSHPRSVCPQWDCEKCEEDGNCRVCIIEWLKKEVDG